MAIPEVDELREMDEARSLEASLFEVGHADAHNDLVRAIRAVAVVVEQIEVTPGPPGDDEALGEHIAALKAHPWYFFAHWQERVDNGNGTFTYTWLPLPAEVAGEWDLVHWLGWTEPTAADGYRFGRRHIFDLLPEVP